MNLIDQQEALKALPPELQAVGIVLRQIRAQIQIEMRSRDADRERELSALREEVRHLKNALLGAKAT